VLAHPKGVLGIAFGPSPRELISGGEDGVIRTWEWEKARVLREMTPVAPRFARSIALSPDGRTVAFGSISGIIGVYDLQAGKPIKSIKAHALSVDCGVEFSRDGKMLVSVGHDEVRIWETSNWTQIATRVPKRKGFMALKPRFAPDSKSLAYALDGHTVSIIRIGEGWEELHQIRLGGREFPECFAYSPSGRIFAVGTSVGTIKLWNSATTERLGQVQLGQAAIMSLVFSPDGKKIGAGLRDSTVVVADVTEFVDLVEKKR